MIAMLNNNSITQAPPTEYQKTSICASNFLR